MPAGKVRFLIRMITFDYSSGSYHDTEIATSKWSKEFIYMLVDACDIIDVTGNITLEKQWECDSRGIQ